MGDPSAKLWRKPLQNSSVVIVETRGILLSYCEDYAIDRPCGWIRDSGSKTCNGEGGRGGGQQNGST